jgi:RNA polymerase sigma-70 factor (ECF subfamily)
MDGQPAASALPLTMRDSPTERLATLFDTHHRRLYRLARRLTDNADDALDLVQETFLKAARAPGSVPSGARAEEAWLVRVLVNLRRDQWRHVGVRERHDQHASRPTETTADHGAAAVARATLWRALDALPPHRRAIVVMHELEELETDAIASLLGISRITVRWHLGRGRRELARALDPPDRRTR